MSEGSKLREPTIRIENVVSSVTLDQPIDLLSVMKAVPDMVEYKPEQFPGLVFRLKKPKTATLIFASGKMVCTGAKSETLAKRAVRKVLKYLKDNGILIVSRPEIKIQNIVASADIHARIDLEKAVFALGRTMYEPEQFPGLIYRMDEPKVVMLLFASGKLVCTGAKREVEVKEAVYRLRDELEQKQLLYYE
ncbi:MAG: TATA-box-binding protein [Nitrososphaerota archaeon]|nr:TATA-box-binding protein [Candidatus Bathyarchaeota archaeon]MCX8162436.1 TATA-box-binding protein [Candidatus Bathyarchaeota archaeon]MDW8062222.1 TATA-box-binding protein [Nitrososphaerota archaeon]